MKGYRRWAVRLTLLSCLLAFFAQPAGALFYDVPEKCWYGDSVQYVRQHGLFQGTGKIKFSPNGTMTRGMFVTVLYRMSTENGAGLPESGFQDVSNGWYYGLPIRWAAHAGIAEAMRDQCFCPEDPITREQMCVMMARYCTYKNFALPETAEPGEFQDSQEIPEESREDIEVCRKAGLIRGYEDGTLRPSGTATRAEVSTIVRRLGELMEGAGYQVGSGRIQESDWRLILVNRWNPMPEGYPGGLTLVDTGNGQKVDARIYDDMAAMFSAMRADGLAPYVNSGFRTNDYQKFLYQRKIGVYQSYGYSYAKAVELAQQWVAVPGTSEHELGLALDISMYAYNSESVYSWLAQHAWEYGFIYRYQAEKQELTGINPEPWHYRYVGRDNAKEIYESGMCLEEFVGYWKK